MTYSKEMGDGRVIWILHIIFTWIDTFPTQRQQLIFTLFFKFQA